ncbi:hypothetical protein HDV00_006933 [Rhizophlyctis rosea]|nr:hypothetical protein HDV00_006933 [Rhizophlyctis rosea]
MIINAGADILILGAHEALSAAVSKGHTEVVSFLLETVSFDQISLSLTLHFAAHMGFAHIAKLLLSHGAVANLGQCIGDGGTRDADALRLLLECGAKDENGQALVRAVLWCSPPIVELLLTSLSSYYKTILLDPTLLIRGACSMNQVEVARLLISHGIATADMNHNYPLHVAIRYGHYDVAKFLLENGADPNAPWPDAPPVLLAAKSAQPAITELLLSRIGTSSFNSILPKHLTTEMHILVRAAQNRDTGLLKRILSDPQSTQDQNAAIVWASQTHDVDAVELLLECGLSPAGVIGGTGISSERDLEKRAKGYRECAVVFARYWKEERLKGF